MVDGDHSADGARRDVEDLLASPSIASTVILAHDSLNQEVRQGLEAVPYGEIDKVAFVDLDFVGGYVPAGGSMQGECWGGLALIVVDESGRFGPAHEGRRPTMAGLSELIWPQADALRGAAAPAPNGAGPATSEAERLRGLIEEMQHSLSWRVTAPLRAASIRFRGRR